MKAVLTILGCCDEVAAAAVKALLCRVLWFPVNSPVVPFGDVWGSTSGLLFTGGAMELEAGRVTSIGSP